jgi:tetraacyldisaccharide 4'-kinase
MRLEPPGWWHGKRPIDRITAALLAPAGGLYGTAVRARFAFARPYRSSLPVVCIGNFTAGGAGKTPLALAIARLAVGMGAQPAFLTRGFGGSQAGPHRVEPGRDTAAEVGDEALLLARAAPTIVSRDRAAGAKAIEARGATLIVMDDGFQNPSVAKDLALIAVDAGAGLGNGFVFPAGPLRAPLRFQLRRADAAVLIGEGAPMLRQNAGLPLIEARLRPSGDTAWLKGQRVVAFSGIGRPAKFFATLRESGAELAGAEAFPDHHAFTEAEAVMLIRKAAEAGAMLVTTEKDWVRMASAAGPLAELKARARALPVELVFSAEAQASLTSLLSRVLKRR